MYFSTSQYAATLFGTPLQDGYTLLNGRLTLADIKSGNRGILKVSAWGKNLTDEEYVVFSFTIDDPVIGITQAFGTPRTAGFDITYEF